MTPILASLRRLRRDVRGNATVEFAMISLFLFSAMMVALDLGLYVQQKLRLGAAVEQAAVFAYVNKVTSNTSGVGTLVTAADSAAQTPTISCNGGSANGAACGDGKCSCVTASGGFAIAASCGAACTGSGTTANAISGNYIKIVATQVYTPMVVPSRVFAGGTITQSAVVRLP
jgi:Flp pilus assembly protein TadG